MVLNKKTIKAGIIGSGHAARFHLKAIQRVYSVKIEVVGVYSRTETNSKRFSTDFDIDHYPNLEALIKSCDVLHLCTSPATHEALAIKILQQDKNVIIEKPLTGYFGNGNENFSGDNFSRTEGLTETLKSIARMRDAEKASKGAILYAENWIYAPAIQKERTVIEETGAQVLWIQGQASHSGSHSKDYGIWKSSGGGSLMGKGCHPLAAAIYLKHIEGKTRSGIPIHPKSVSCRTHAITRLQNFRNEGHLRDSYIDVEDYAYIHVVFEDSTIADITANELLHGGVKNYLEVHANNHRTICNLAPNNAMQVYNPLEENFRDIYIVEKTGTKQGWSNISPDEDWFNGYQQEVEAFYRCVAEMDEIESNSQLAGQVTATIYCAYLSAEKNGSEIQIPKI